MKAELVSNLLSNFQMDEEKIDPHVKKDTYFTCESTHYTFKLNDVD